jgi:hypothetical protein
MSETTEFNIGEYTIILDAEDLEKASRHNWKTNKNHKTGLSFHSTIIDPKVGWIHKKWRGKEWKQRKRKNIFLHRLLLGAPGDVTVVHLNGNELDYRKENLKVCTQAELNESYNVMRLRDAGDKKVKELLLETLSHGTCIVKFDAEDWDTIKWYRWGISFSKAYHDHLYATAFGVLDGDPRHIRLHRLIMDPPAGKVVDHISGKTLDNRRSNLRICSHSENARNRRRTTTGAEIPFKGVKRNKGHADKALDGKPLNPYAAQINVNNKREHLGIFATPEEAALVYDQRAKELHGDFAKLNFPDGPTSHILEIIEEGKTHSAGLRQERKEQPRQQKKAKGSRSVHLGVGYNTKCTKRPWTARIHCTYLGSFATEEEAAHAYNEKAPAVYGPDATLNQV